MQFLPTDGTVFVQYMTEDQGEIWKTYEFVSEDIHDRYHGLLEDLSSALFRESQSDWRMVQYKQSCDSAF